MHLLNTVFTCSRRSAQRRMSAVCDPRFYCCTLICPFAVPNCGWEEKTHGIILLSQVTSLNTNI